MRIIISSVGVIIKLRFCSFMISFGLRFSVCAFISLKVFYLSTLWGLIMRLITRIITLTPFIRPLLMAPSVYCLLAVVFASIFSFPSCSSSPRPHSHY